MGLEHLQEDAIRRQLVQHASEELVGHADCATGQMLVALALPRVHRVEGHPEHEQRIIYRQSRNSRDKIRHPLCHDAQDFWQERSRQGRFAMDERAQVDDAQTELLVGVLLLYRPAFRASAANFRMKFCTVLRAMEKQTFVINPPLVNTVVSDAEQALLETEIGVIGLLRGDVERRLQLRTGPANANNRHRLFAGTFEEAIERVS